MKAFNVAILGATGMVGQELLDILVEREFPIKNLTLLSSPRSAGTRVLVGGKEYAVQEVSAEGFVMWISPFRRRWIREQRMGAGCRRCRCFSD